ncbi:sporulation protein [Kushneria pakistanensis]|uniref:Sporulation protein n=1 Tax=Kushneria pakistanensis TaxID=1508770 RepID=A0ABQ3FLL5_9GAMM|nr:SPOR domain-containing protein [Kushneria pakistanensis]GHC28937.1 sporulation protein [Kushneria pakistanensis]
MAQRQNKSAPSSKGATSRNKAKRGGGGDGFHVPGWLWALVGIIAGFAIAQYFHNDAPPKRDQVAAVVAKKRADGGDQQQGSESSPQDAEEGQMPTFEFYTLLPESEVIAPNVEDYSSSPRPGTEGAVLEQHARRIAGSSSSASVSNPDGNKAASSQQSAPARKPEPAPEPKGNAGSNDAIQQLASRHEAADKSQRASSNSGSSSGSSSSGSSSSSGPSYMLQAASFKSQSDANTMAGKLRDLGLVTQVSQVKTADNTTWYRVQAGPYRDAGELSRAKGLMQTRGIDPMQIQQR